MKSFLFRVSLCGLILSFYVITTGCKAGKPMRKTLPDRFSSNGTDGTLWEKQGAGFASDNISSELPFYASDTTVNGETYTAIYLRNPDFDSVAAGIIKSYEPFAGALLRIVAEQGIKGVVVDFRQQGDVQTTQANFLVTNHYRQGQDADNTPTINMIFLWDDLSYSRAAGFMSELKDAPMLAVKDINNKDLFSAVSKQDCFNPPAPGFDVP